MDRRGTGQEEVQVLVILALPQDDLLVGEVDDPAVRLQARQQLGTGSTPKSVVSLTVGSLPRRSPLGTMPARPPGHVYKVPTRDETVCVTSLDRPD